MDALTYALSLDYQYVNDTLTAQDGSTVNAQAIQRAGLGIELWWADAPPPPRFGSLVVSVLDADSGASLGGASVALSSDGQSRSLTLDAQGRAVAMELQPGEVAASATFGGYLPQEAKGSVVAGRETALEIRLKKEPKGREPGVIIIDKETQSQSRATVTVGGKEPLNEAGKVLVSELRVDHRGGHRRSHLPPARWRR